jgi:hypothetical protein
LKKSKRKTKSKEEQRYQKGKSKEEQKITKTEIKESLLKYC